jgi:hypothetical protein
MRAIKVQIDFSEWKIMKLPIKMNRFRFENTRVFLYGTPGWLGLEHPGGLPLNTRVFRLFRPFVINLCACKYTKIKAVFL